jgi:heterodisulfide reductase subunit B
MEEVLDKSDKNLDKSDKNQPAFTGFGAEWRPSNLTPSEARAATSWVEAKIDRRSMLTNKDRVADIRDAMWQLEKDGEILVHRIDERHEPVVARTLYGWEKRIPTTNLWHHKSCGQCGNIPGYPSSVMWLMNKLNVRYIEADSTDQRNTF